MKTVGKYIQSVILGSIGFALAAILNIVVPVKADVSFEKYIVAGYLVDSNEAYRIVLLAIIILFILKAILDYRDEARRKKYIRGAKFRFVMGILLFVWDALGTKYQILTQPFFPGPAGIMEAFLSEGDFIWKNTLYSLKLYLYGFIIGTFAGIVIGTLVGWFKRVDYWISPVLKVLGVVPAVVWMPFALTLLPTAFGAAVFLIAVSVWILVATLTAAGVKDTPKRQLEAARTLGGGQTYQVFHVAIPHAMPQIFTGITTANGYAFTTLVMAEMMGQPGGLGYYINASKVWSAYYKVFAAIIVMALMFSIITTLLEKIQNYILRWQKGVLK